LSSFFQEFPASNLLKGSTFNKWRSEKGGTPNEVVELDFGEPVEVNRLDIGNNGSAFVEVLVRRAASSASPMVFLPCSSFMSPADAKNENNLFRVRVFSGDQLYDVAAKQKWDIFRIVCTQPFNKTLPYGISFISFHTSGAKEAPSPNCVNENSGDLATNDEETDEGSSEFLPGALFQASKSKSLESNPTTPAPRPAVTVTEKLRAAQQGFLKNLLESSVASNTSGSTKPTVPFIPKDAPETKPVSPKPHHISTERSNPKSAKRSEPSGKQKSPLTPNAPSGSNPPKTKEKIDSRRRRRPLAGVIFTLSGYQNPLRSDLRQKAVQLGAQYRQDWGPDCTHLM
ncbi:X-ray repair complementing defective repair in Chinese hamster cells 1, partial [Fasciolopsis buskii]